MRKEVKLISIILLCVICLGFVTSFYYLNLNDFGLLRYSPLGSITSENLSFSGSQNFTREFYGVIFNGTIITQIGINITGNISDSSGTQFIFIGNSTTGYTNDTVIWSLKNSEFYDSEAFLRRLNDTSTSKTLTFQDNSTDVNKTVYIKLPKYAVINDFRLNLSSSSYGIQLASTTYSSYCIVTPSTSSFDLNATSWVFGTIKQTGSSTVPKTLTNNFSQPINVQISYGDYPYENYTQFDGHTLINLTNYTYYNWITITNDSYSNIQDGVSIRPLLKFQSNATTPIGNYSGFIFVNYTSPSNISNPYLMINNNQIWNFSGVFNQSNNRTENIADNLTTYLSTCTPDSDGYCTIPLLFHSDTNGSITISDIYVNYTNISVVDFTTKFNNAQLNNTCNCSGCITIPSSGNESNSCSVQLTFHSDVTGNLTWQHLNVSLYAIPFVKLISPENGSSKFSYANITCNSTYIAWELNPLVNISSVTLFVWNSTGIVNNSMINLFNDSDVKSSYQFWLPKDDSYIWNCQTNDTNGISVFASHNKTFFGLTTSPAITLIDPLNNDFTGNASITLARSLGLNFSFICYVEGNNLDTLMIYTNSSGTFERHSWDTTPLNYQNNSLDVSSLLPDGNYLWTCAVNQTSGTLTFANSNRTFTFDTRYPNMTINSITTTSGSQTINFANSISDLNLNSSDCKYSIYNNLGNIDGLNNNVSFTCGSTTSATVSSYGTFTLKIYANDYADNENSINQSFTTTSSVTGGGGGGGSPENSRVVSLLKPTEDPNSRSDLDRAIIFRTIYNYSQLGEIQSSQYPQIIKIMQNDGVSIPISLLPYWINQFKNKQFEVVEIPETDANKYHLIKSEVIFGSIFSVNPSNINTYYFINLCSGTRNWTVQVKANKVLANCKGLSGNFNCRIISPSVAEISYIFKSNNFTIANLEGEVEYVSAEKETARTKILYLNVINTCGQVELPLGTTNRPKINVLVLTGAIIGFIVALIIFIYTVIKVFRRNRKAKTINR